MDVGSQVGPYELVGRIGAGGMGEVWRARDKRLHREVAIKVLHGTTAHSEDASHSSVPRSRMLVNA